MVAAVRAMGSAIGFSSEGGQARRDSWEVAADTSHKAKVIVRQVTRAVGNCQEVTAVVAVKSHRLQRVHLAGKVTKQLAIRH